jgi:hypothetical protein
MKYMTTIVSCFITGVNNIKFRDTHKYLELGKLLIDCDIPKIIFMNQVLIDSIKDYNRETTILIPFEKEDLFFNGYKNDITNFSVIGNPDKDTLDYMLLMNNKTEFIQSAIKMNPFHTDHFIWIDFGINHIMNLPRETFMEKICNLKNNKYENIRIASLKSPLLYNDHSDIYKNVEWYFGGSMFGGSSEKLLLFAEKSREKVKEVIQEKKTLMWEVNIWYLVFLENKELFDIYTCRFDNSMLINY